ncbi:alcohol acetyltransferase [Ophiocordyceps camponoti-floridani]|uniref:Alcohol acetyltransferase n=1 Tax=Ophiocordyceps camponoti-floridani TaxID=2030778 RepID=A0A8H4Q708_9HYPO|nr:alcohol acetyltransferase [Ophiocordyceps camponoti-floridani]
MLAHIGDWFAHWASRDGEPREDSWEISNAGVIAGRRREGDACYISRLSFANGPMVAGPPIGLGVGSVPGGVLTVLVSWQEGVVPAELMAGLVHDLGEWTRRLGEEGSFFTVATKG